MGDLNNDGRLVPGEREEKRAIERHPVDLAQSEACRLRPDRDGAAALERQAKRAARVGAYRECRVFGTVAAREDESVLDRLRVRIADESLENMRLRRRLRCREQQSD